MAVWSRGCQLCCHASGFALSCMELHATDWLNSGIVLVSCSSSGIIARHVTRESGQRSQSVLVFVAEARVAEMK